MVCFDSLTIILEHRVTILLVKMLFGQLSHNRCVLFISALTPDMFHHFLKTAPYMRILKSLDLNRD